MIEKHIVLEEIDPALFYGANNANLQMIKALFPKLRIMARGNVIRAMGDDEVLETFENYIKLCAENDVPMTMSTACLAIGVSKSTLTTWRAGKTRTEDYREFAESVVYAVQAGLEAMMATGLVNPVVGIWWEKSHFGMVEATKGEAVESDPLGVKRSAEEIAAEYEGIEGGLPE